MGWISEADLHHLGSYLGVQAKQVGYIAYLQRPAADAQGWLSHCITSSDLQSRMS